MKKLKKFLAGAIALAMAMSMFTMTAFATELTEQDESVTSASTINASRNGSITIHKYVKDDTKTWPGSTGEALENNTSEEGQDTSKLPYGAVGLGGVEFTIFRIVTASELIKYYGGGSDDEIAAITAKIPSKEQLEGFTFTKNEDEDGNVSYTLGGWTGTYVDTITTSSDEANKGVASKNGLELGIYLVIETSSPDNVVTPATPFLVSIPMTVNNEWIYDVHVYPKNKTASSGEVQLAKVGKVAGSDTLTPLPGAKFQVEKLETSGETSDETSDETSGKTGVWKTVTKTRDKNGNEADLGQTLTIGGVEYKGVLTSSDEEGKKGLVTVSNLTPGDYRFVEIMTGDGYILRDNVAWYFTINSDGDVEWKRSGKEKDSKEDAVYELIKYGEEGKVEKFGFYKEGTLTYPETSPEPYSIGGIPYAVNEKPDIEKEVAPKGTPYHEVLYYEDHPEDGGYIVYDSYDKEADYSVGDKIPYKLTVKLPDQKYQYTLPTFKIYDEPTNMTDDIDSIKVIVASSDGTAFETTDFSIEEYGTGGFVIDCSGKLLSYETLIITYTATLTKDEEITTKDGNPNEAKLVYSNSYNGTGTNEITDRAIVYSAEIDVLKHIGDDKKSPLSGVKFDLYEEIVGKTQGDVTDGKITVAGVEKTVVSETDAASAGLDAPKTKVYVQIKKDLSTGSDGKINVKGLSDGTYWLVETATATGYNLLEGPVEVSLKIDHEVQMSETSTWTLKQGTTTNEYILVKNAITGTTFGGSSTLAKNEDGTLKNNTLQISKEVINRKGFTLPTTGGMGTFVFTFVGIAMMAAAVILFITSKKKEAK